MQVSMGTLRRMLLRNELPAFKVGGQWRVNERELTKWTETLSAAFRTL
jgi:excisionase family DNA binding protein